MNELLVMVGVPGSGKSTFAAERYPWWQILSSDIFRAYIAEGAHDETADAHTFDALHAFAEARCRFRRVPTVVDATNILAEHRAPLIEIAYRNLMMPVAVVFDVPLKVCRQRNAEREQQVPDDVIEEKWDTLRQQIESGSIFAEFPVCRRVYWDGGSVLHGNIPVDQIGRPWLR